MKGNFQIQGFDLETFGILENWSLRRSGPLPNGGQPGCSLATHLQRR